MQIPITSCTYLFDKSTTQASLDKAQTYKEEKYTQKDSTPFILPKLHSPSITHCKECPTIKEVSPFPNSFL